MEDDRPVSQRDIGAILNLMEGKEQVAKLNRELLEDPTIKNRKQLIEALKEGRVSGAAIIEWRDDKGLLRANVIDFISKQTIIGTDPQSGEQVKVGTQFLSDGSWRILY